eukprot:scaffold241_cov89-Cylindrotheca_fusiformis.AAC.9
MKASPCPRRVGIPIFAMVVHSLVGLVAVATVLFLVWDPEDSSDCDDDGDDDSDSKEEEDEQIFHPELPSHVIRAVHKERRRKDSVRFLAMKKPMYDNIQMYDPDGDLLCTISQKKANWYVKKKLGQWKNNSQRDAIHLLFRPKGKTENVYNQSEKENICVSCGDDQHHMRHYVVPYCYRTLFPEKYKTHMPHDIGKKKATQKRQKELEQRLRKYPKTTANKVIPCKELYHARSCALALLNHGNKLPETKKEEYENVVLQRHNNITDENATQLTTNQLQKIVDMEFTIPNPNYIPGPELVINDLQGDDEKIISFIRDWRVHFLETVQPRFLPIGWTVDSPFQCDNPR